jgi:hypothetical protein
MNNALNTTFPFAAIEAIRSDVDDPLLRGAAMWAAADDCRQSYNRESKNKSWGTVVGAGSHGLRPHQTRWTKAGGFAYPRG